MGTHKTDPLKQNQIPSLPLIRAGREIRGQISLSTCVRKKLNREPRERTRKEDEEFEQRKGGRARRLAGLTFLPNGDVNRVMAQLQNSAPARRSPNFHHLHSGIWMPK